VAEDTGTAGMRAVSHDRRRLTASAAASDAST